VVYLLASSSVGSRGCAHEMASHEIYYKTPLDPQGQSVRLVEILSANKTSGITLKFHTYQLHANTYFPGSRPKYYALSYTWGHTTNQRPILVDGTKFYIRENLWYFLQQQTYLKAGDLIWIDALCIDQGNIPERNHQVMMMASIFSQVQSSFLFEITHCPGAENSRQVTFSCGSAPPRMTATKLCTS
jgi:hypothetical protein